MSESLPAVELVLRLLAYGTGAFTILFSAASVLAARRFRAKAREASGAGHAPPPITILKPIKGADSGIYANLASFLAQDYPRFQILFALQDPEDPALGILRDLRRDFPEADMEIVVSKNRIGHNPKINNLSNAYAYARHDTLLISDSDIRVDPDFLRRAVAPLADPAVGMVTCFYRSPSAPGLGGLLEALSVNAQFLPQALTAGYGLGLRFAMGAAMLVRRAAFEAAGGFAALSGRLADDFVLGGAVAAAGWRLEFAGVVVDSVPDPVTLPEHLAHLARWSRTIRACQPRGYAGLLLLQGFALASLHLALFGPRPTMLALWLAVAAARALSVARLHIAYLSNPGILAQLPLLPLADLLWSAAWLAGLRSRAVLWRGEYYRIGVEGRLAPVRPDRSLPAAGSPSPAG